jgi:hypothetical protein
MKSIVFFNTSHCACSPDQESFLDIEPSNSIFDNISTLSASSVAAIAADYAWSHWTISQIS